MRRTASAVRCGSSSGIGGNGSRPHFGLILPRVAPKVLPRPRGFILFGAKQLPGFKPSKSVGAFDQRNLDASDAGKLEVGRGNFARRSQSVLILGLPMVDQDARRKRLDGSHVLCPKHRPAQPVRKGVAARALFSRRGARTGALAGVGPVGSDLPFGRHDQPPRLAMATSCGTSSCLSI
jgi:hypothetical protein